MWRLRQNVLYNKHYFFKEILFFVIGFHTIFLCLMCLVDTTQLQPERFVLDAQKLQSTVVFMPLHKKVAIKNQSSSGEHTSQKKLLNHDEYLALQKKETKSAGKQEKNKKKETSKNKKSEQKKEPIVGKTDKKEKKKNPPAETKKVAPKVEKKSPTLALPEKKVVERKELVEKKPLPQVAAKELQQEEPKQEALVHQPVALPVFQAEPIVEPVTEQEKDGEEDELVLNEDEISFVGRVDLELIQIKEMIHGQVAKFYKPPVGISKKAVCELSVCVGLSGKADRVVVEKSSGSVANDACARAALLQVTFPKEVIGKKIIIELGQS
jgi:hypothetical protein